MRTGAIQGIRTTLGLPPTKTPWRLVENHGKVTAINPQHTPFKVESGNIIKEFKKNAKA